MNENFGTEWLKSFMTEAPIIQKPVNQDWFLYDADLRHEKVKIDSSVFNFYFLLSLFLNLFSPYYRSFKPILRLLESCDAPASQYWAAWALANLTKVYRKFFFENK